MRSWRWARRAAAAAAGGGAAAAAAAAAAMWSWGGPWGAASPRLALREMPEQVDWMNGGGGGGGGGSGGGSGGGGGGGGASSSAAFAGAVAGGSRGVCGGLGAAAASAPPLADPVWGCGRPKMSSRERRFLEYASMEHLGQVYMTPGDFLDSVTYSRPEAGDPLTPT
ncbi:uncharacterized protein LOC144954615 [Lampetra fluviatilis]